MNTYLPGTIVIVTEADGTEKTGVIERASLWLAMVKFPGDNRIAAYPPAKVHPFKVRVIEDAS